MHRTASNLLPPVNEVWGKVIFSQASVILFTGKLGIGFPACITGHMTREAGMPPGGSASGKGCVGQIPPTHQINGILRYGQETGGTYPTGRHSCFRAVFGSLKY